MRTVERQAQILVAARSVALRDGLSKMSVRAVAKEAGVPLGNLQWVFPTKMDLYRALIEDVVDEIIEVLNRARSATGSAPGLVDTRGLQ